MKRHLVGVATLLLSSWCFAQAPTQPTSSAKPLPNLQETQNIDTVIREKVQEKLSKLPILKNQTVSAASHDQTIILEGSVETKAQETAAIKAAKSVAGVKEVRSQLTIKFEAPQNKK